MTLQKSCSESFAITDWKHLYYLFPEAECLLLLDLDEKGEAVDLC